jgi:peptidoglycan hydrolase-like protein with peptidoglycan-binding domain
VIWALQYAQNVPGGGANIMRRSWVTRYESNKGMQISADNGGRGIGRLAITKYGLTLYEPTDVRGGEYAVRRYYLFNNPVGIPAGKKLGDTLKTVQTLEKASDPLWPSTRKWDWADPLDVAGSAQYGDQSYIRLAETYLLLAEAQFKQGKTAEAATTINLLRTRAGASQIGAAQVTLDFILDERSRELVTEEQRRYTLLRTGTWFDRTKKYNPLAAVGMTPRDTLLAIPQSVIDANFGKPMKQNPGF